MSKAIYLFVLVYANISWGQTVAVTAKKDQIVTITKDETGMIITVNDAKAIKEACNTTNTNFTRASLVVPAVSQVSWVGSGAAPSAFIGTLAKTSCGARAVTDQIVSICSTPTGTCGAQAQMTIKEKESSLAKRVQKLDKNLKDLAGIFSKEVGDELSANVLPKEEVYKKFLEDNKDNTSNAAEANNVTTTVPKEEIVKDKSQTINSLNEENDKVGVIRRQFEGAFVQEGMSGSFKDLINYRHKLVLSSFYCISQTQAAEIDCKIAESDNGQKAAKKMEVLANSSQRASSMLGGGSASQILQLSKTAFILAREDLLKAQIRCGTSIEVADLSCNAAEKYADKFTAELQKMNETAKKINVAAEAQLVKIVNDQISCEIKTKSKPPQTCTTEEINVPTREQAYLKIRQKSGSEIPQLVSAIAEELKAFKDTPKDQFDTSTISKNKLRLSMLSQGPYVEHSQMQNMLFQNASQSMSSLKQLTGSTDAGDGEKDIDKKDLTVAEMCAKPANAQTSLCKCRLNNSAPGCAGHIAAIATQSVVEKTTSTEGPSSVASIPNKINGLPGANSIASPNLTKLSIDAQNALAASSSSGLSTKVGESGKTDSEFKASAAASASGSGGSIGPSASGSANTTKSKDGEKEESKSIGSAFSNAVGSFFKGSFFGGGRSSPSPKQKSSSDTFVKTDIQRSIASQQARSEVSNASGVSNWEKVKQRYKNQNDSLISN